MSNRTKVGFLGLGAMGAPMAERVLRAGFPLFTAAHRRREPAERLAALGATVLATPAEVARAADSVITIVPADAELEQVALGPAGLREGFSPGKILIEMTTATAATLGRVEAALAPAGVRLLDAPVSGGTRIIHVGALGQGKVVKMVNQLMAATHLLAMGEAFALGVRCGADPRTLYEVIKESSGYSRMMDARLPNFLLAGSFAPGFKLDLMKKDVNLALESARAEGVPLLLGSLVAQVFSAASASGAGEADFAAAARFLADLAHVNLAAAAAQSA